MGIYEQLAIDGDIPQEDMVQILEYQERIIYEFKGVKPPFWDDLVRLRRKHELGVEIRVNQVNIEKKIREVEDVMVKWQNLAEDLKAIINTNLIHNLINDNFKDNNLDHFLLTTEEIYEKGDHLKDHIIDFINPFL